MVIGSFLFRGTNIINEESGSLTTAWYNIPGVMPHVSEHILWHYLSLICISFMEVVPPQLLMLPSWGSNSNVDVMIKNDKTCASKKIHNTNFLLFRVQLWLKYFFHPTSEWNRQGRSMRNYNFLIVTLISWNIPTTLITVKVHSQSCSESKLTAWFSRQVHQYPPI